MADSVYDLKELINQLQNIFDKTIIKPNNYNTKNINKIRKLNKEDEKIYKKRIIVEHMNKEIKSYRRLNTMYERNIENYKQLIYLSLCEIVNNRIIQNE